MSYIERSLVGLSNCKISLVISSLVAQGLNCRVMKTTPSFRWRKTCSWHSLGKWGLGTARCSQFQDYPLCTVLFQLTDG